MPQLKSFRLFFILCTVLNLDTYQFDVSGAFLNSPLQYEIWVKLPKGYKGFGEKHTHGILRKSMYALKQAARDWSILQDTFVMGYDKRFRRSSVEPCMYYLNNGDLWVILLVQVDDYSIGTNDEEYKRRFVEAHIRQSTH